MGRSANPPIRDPIELLLSRARTYVYRKRYLQVMLFSKWWTDVDLLQRRFGGNHYKHLKGYVWMLTNRDSLVRLVADLQEHLPSKYGFEDKIIQYYMQQKPPDE